MFLDPMITYNYNYTVIKELYNGSDSNHKKLSAFAYSENLGIQLSLVIP